MYNSRQYIENFIKPVFIQKQNILEINSLFFMEKIFLTYSLNDLVSDDEGVILEMVSILERVTGQKVVLLKNLSVFVGSKKVFVFSVGVTLRKKRMYSFLNYLMFVFSPFSSRRIGLFKISNRRDVTGFCVDDIESFYQLKLLLRRGKLHIAMFHKKDCVILKEYCKLLKLPII